MGFWVPLYLAIAVGMIVIIVYLAEKILSRFSEKWDKKRREFNRRKKEAEEGALVQCVVCEKEYERQTMKKCNVCGWYFCYSSDGTGICHGKVREREWVKSIEDRSDSVNFYGRKGNVVGGAAARWEVITHEKYTLTICYRCVAIINNRIIKTHGVRTTRTETTDPIGGETHIKGSW